MIEERECFIICPIGEEGTDIRRRSDQMFHHLFEPVIKDCGYKAIRADKISKPGIITSQIIQKIIDAPLVIADLTGHNPNVLYEVALRHVIKRPLVQLIQKGETLPFDIAATRVIYVDYPDLNGIEKAKKELDKQIKSLEKDTENFDNPISIAIDLKELRQSSNFVDRQIGEISASLQELKSAIFAIAEHIIRIEVDIKNIGYRPLSEAFTPSWGKVALTLEQYLKELAEMGRAHKAKEKDVWVAKEKGGDEEGG